MTKDKLSDNDIKFLDAAYDEARLSLKEGGIPIGAVLVFENVIIARGHNKRIQENSMIKHGETDCIENTKRQYTPQQLQQTTLYTTLSPCFMCAGTVVLNNIRRIVIGENKTFTQAEDFLRQQGTEIVIANHDKFIQLMKDFILANPKLWGEDIGLSEAEVLARY